MSVTIEKARAEDAPELLRYLRQIGGETANLTFGAEGLPISPEEEAHYITQWENSPDGILLVAKENGKIVGDASLLRQPRRMAHRGDFSIAVVQSCWGRGIGTRLMRRVLEFAQENAFEILDLQVRKDNERAIRLYERFGFRTLCTYPRFFKLENGYVDFLLMQLRLTP